MKETILAALKKHVDPKKRDFFPIFFKTQAGEYAEGDVFLGVTVPHCRTVARMFKDISRSELVPVLHSEFHEMRLVALFILVSQFERGDEDKQRDIYTFYIEHIHFVNNWDLVDASAPKIIGAYLLTKPTKQILTYARARDIWLKRIAMVSTFAFIKEGELDLAYEVARILLHDKHDLVQKAVGWMLREAGKMDEKRLLSFLDEYATSMPRTALRYSLEKLPAKKRDFYMQK